MIVLPAILTTGEIELADVMMSGLVPIDMPEFPAMMAPDVGMIGARGGGSFESVSPGMRRIRSTLGALATGISAVGVFLLA